jgi:hypothetical protein
MLFRIGVFGLAVRSRFFNVVRGLGVVRIEYGDARLDARLNLVTFREARNPACICLTYCNVTDT